MIGQDEQFDADELDEVIDCPNCGREIYADAEQCNHCGHWITVDDYNRELHRRNPLRLVLVLVIVLLIAVFVVMGALGY